MTVEPDDVAYTTSSPARSTGAAPWFAISTNSSDADAPPVWTSDTTRLETGQATSAASAADGTDPYPRDQDKGEDESGESHMPGAIHD